jgi:hypothetical protein
MKFTTAHLTLAAALAFGALGTGCATKPDVRADQDPGVDLASYQTFGFQPAAESSPYNTLLAARLKTAARDQLERAHYVYSEQAPDLRVNLRLVVSDKQELRSVPTGRIGWRTWTASSIETVSYRQGTLAIDLVAAHRNALVWHGVAEGRLDAKAMEQPGPAIEAAVGEIFARFPGAGAKP